MTTLQALTASIPYRAVRSDRLLQVFLGLLVVASLPIFYSSDSQEATERYLDLVFSPLTLGAAIVIVASSARVLGSARERKFWYLIGAALLALWLAGSASASPGTAGLTWLVMTDSLYLVFYLLMALAALSPPDRSRVGPRRVVSAEVFGLALTLLGFLAYFVLVPSSFATERYRSWLPSMYLFQVLDLLLIFLFGRLVRDTICPRWRSLYSVVLAAVLGWTALDALEVLDLGGWVSLPKAGSIDLLWTLPILTLVIASRAAFLPSKPLEDECEEEQTATPKLANVALVATIAFPLIHLLLSSAGMVDPGLRRPREVIVLASVVALGIVALLERAEVQRVRWKEQRKREAAEDSLRESEMRYRQLFEHAPEAIVVFDQDSGLFVDANQRALDLLEVDRAGLLVSGPLDFSPRVQPDGRDSAEAAQVEIASALAGENPSFEWLHRNASGEDIPCEVFLTAYPWAGRRLVRGSIVDVSDQVVLREQLRQSQRMESIGQLAGGIAHDFNNLLTVISGYCDLALARPGLDPGLRSDIEEVRSAGDSATALTSQLLAFSRRQVLRLEPIDLNRVVEGMREMLARLVGEDLQLVVKLQPDLREVMADEGQVEQTLMNLAANARDAMPGGGFLGIETSVIELRQGAALPREAKPGLYGQLTVSDTGSGMDAATRERVFEPFFTTKSLGHGTGLGLATVYGIVAQSGGFIDVDSTLGEGSRFTVNFPLAPNGYGATSAPIPMEIEESRGRETVLLVEDEAAVRQLLRAGLESFGYRVSVAPDGEAALEVARTPGLNIDVLVSDVVLPGKDGPRVAKEIQSSQPGVKVIFISGYTDDLLARKGEMAEGHPFLQKPFTAVKLAAEIRKTLRSPSAA